MENIKIVSVIRNMELYEKLVKNNGYYKNADFVIFDNRSENISIAKNSCKGR